MRAQGTTRRRVERARAGDAVAGEAPRAHFTSTLQRFLEHQMDSAVRRWAEPEDIVQIVLAAVMRDLDNGQPEIDEDALCRRLFGVTRWRISDLPPRQRGELGASQLGHITSVRPARAASMGPVTVDDRAHWVHRLIDRLPPDQRALEGLEFAEVGVRLGIEADAARMRFGRAIEALRARDKPRELDPD